MYNRAYHRYFEGYAEKVTPGKNGGTKIKREYVGDTYHHEIDDKVWKHNKIMYPVLFCASAVLYLVISAQPEKANELWYVAAPECLALLCFLITGYVLVCFTASHRNMTVREFRKRQQLIACTALCAGFLALCAVGSVVYLVLTGSVLWSVCAIVGFSICSLAMLFVHKTEKGIFCLKTKGSGLTDDESYEIKNEDPLSHF